MARMTGLADTVRNLLLVLDLDETLLYATTSPMTRPADFAVGDYHVYKRPHVDDFLAQCFAWFDVAVWTSASVRYAAGIVAALFPQSPVFVWAGDRCTSALDLETGERFDIKDLKKVKKLGYDLDHILVVDDSAEKHRRSYGNLIRVSAYMGADADAELPMLLPYLDRLRTVENVRAVEKRDWRSGAGNKGETHEDQCA